MPLDRSDVENIAHLARLQIGEADITEFEASLSSILELVEQMNSADTTGITPMAHPLDATARLRPDVASEPNQRETFQQGAPAVDQGLYLVPKVID